MYGYVYKVINLLNNKVYIGAKLGDEFNNLYYGSGTNIKLAIKLDGIENFKLELIEKCYSKEELIKKELYWINKYNSTNKRYGYNIHKIGMSGRVYSNLSDEEKQLYKIKQIKAQSNRIWIYKDLIRKRIKLNELDFYLLDGWKKGINISNRKVIHKGSKIKVIDLEKLNEYISANWSLGMPINNRDRFATFKGRHHSEESKKKIAESISISQRGNNNSMYGRHHSEESKKKIAESIKATNKIKIPSKEELSKYYNSNNKSDSYRKISEIYKISYRTASRWCKQLI